MAKHPGTTKDRPLTPAPPGASPRVRARLNVVVAVLLGFFLAVVGMLYCDQVLWHEDWLKKALANIQRKSTRLARRGEVRDIRGYPLATCVPVKTVCADPSLLCGQQAQVARALAPILELPAPDLFQQLQPRLRVGTNGVPLRNDRGELITNAYVVLKRKVPVDQWEQVRQATARLALPLTAPRPTRRQKQTHALAQQNLRQRAVFAEDDELRQYPAGSLAAHVLGFVGTAERRAEGGVVSEIVGKDGIERTVDHLLSGVPGWVKTSADRAGRELRVLREQEVAPRRGLNVVLTLDAGLQHIVEVELEKAFREHGPVSASAIVVRPRTGEILALANCPTFDPNQPGTNVTTFRNHAVGSLLEPGSTFKMVTVAAALEAGAVGLDEMIFCENGRWFKAGRSLSDHHAYGWLPVRMVVAKSSNIGTAKIAERLGPELLYRSITNFGFAARTFVPLPAEAVGVVRPTARWTPLSITRVPIGHEVSATPLQTVMAAAAIAYEGVLMRPRLIDRVEDESGRVLSRFDPQPVRRVVRPETARAITEALKLVATREGTAVRAKLDYYTVAGKTGTAEKFVNGTYKSGHYYASFIGFFPADRPELCIGVFLDDLKQNVPHTGGLVAAPVFRDIATRAASYLRIPPERSPDDVPAEIDVPSMAGAKRAPQAAQNAAASRPPAAGTRRTLN